MWTSQREQQHAADSVFYVSSFLLAFLYFIVVLVRLVKF